MSVLFANNASSRIPQDVPAGSSSIPVFAGEGARFPSPTGGNHFMVTLEDRRTGQIEICRCTARNGDILTVIRAQEGTTAQTFLLGTTVSNRLTAGTIIDFTGVPEAPIDGKIYGRKDLTWIESIAKTTFDAEVARQNGINNSQNNAISNLQNDVGTIEGDLTDQDARLDAIEVKNTQQDGQISAINVTNTGQDDRLDGIDAEQDAQDALIADLETTKLDDGPHDGFVYGRKDGAWSTVIGGASTDAAPPPGPLQNGQLWWESDTGKFYVYYDDGNTKQWVQPIGGKGAKGDPGVPGADGADGADGSPDTAAQVLAKLVTVDGAGSTLDADLLDGQHGTYYQTALGYTPINKTGDTMTGALSFGAAAALSSLGTDGDITISRADTTTGAIYFGKSANKYIFYDGTTFHMAGGGANINGNVKSAGAGNFIGNDGGGIVLSPGVAGTVYLRPGGVGVSATQWTIGTSGDVSQPAGYYSMAGSFTASGSVTSHTQGYKPGGGDWIATSDERIKLVRSPYETGLDAIKALFPVRYVFKGNDTLEEPRNTALKAVPEPDGTMPQADKNTPTVPYPNSPHYQAALDEKEFIGFVAQEVEPVMPEMVITSSAFIDGAAVDDLKQIDTNALIYALVNAVKELAAKVEALEAGNGV